MTNYWKPKSLYIIVYTVQLIYTEAHIKINKKATFIYYSLYSVVVIIHDSHVSGWWFESQDGQTFFSDFLLSLFPYIWILILHFYHCRYFKNDFINYLILWICAYTYIIFLQKLWNYFKKSDRLSENPAPFIYYSDSRKETVWIYIGRTGFTLFRRFRRFRRAELPDSYSMQCTPLKYLLRYKHLRKYHFICCSSLEWHLWHPLILKVTSQSDEMPDSTVLRAARTSSVINLKTISEVGKNLTYQGSFVSPSNTYDQRLKKVPFELPKNSKESLDTRSVQAKGSVATHSSDLHSLFLSQSFICLLRHLCKNALPFQTSWNE